MQKIIVFIFLFSILIAAHAEEALLKKEKNAKITQLIQDEHLTDLIKSPDGKWIAFVKQSDYTVPSNCFYFFTKGERANEIWIINTAEMTKRLLVSPNFNCKDVSK